MGIARICGETPEFRHQDGMNIYLPVWSDQWRLDQTMALSTGFERESALTSRIPQTDAIQKAALSSILDNKYRKSSIEVFVETRPFIVWSSGCQVTSLSCNYFPRRRFRLQLGPFPSPTKICGSKSGISLPPPKCDFQNATITFCTRDSAFNEATCLP
jgi:hypothetical protein